MRFDKAALSAVAGKSTLETLACILSFGPAKLKEKVAPELRLVLGICQTVASVALAEIA